MAMTNDRQQAEMKNLSVTTTTISVIDEKSKYRPMIEPDKRDNWGNKIVYLLSIIGFVVDLGKSWNKKIFHPKRFFF